MGIVRPLVSISSHVPSVCMMLFHIRIGFVLATRTAIGSLFDVGSSLSTGKLIRSIIIGSLYMHFSSKQRVVQSTRLRGSVEVKTTQKVIYRYSFCRRTVIQLKRV